MHGSPSPKSIVSDGECLRPIESKTLNALTLFELKGKDAHTDQIRTMDALEAFGKDRANAQKKRGLRRPVARRPAAVHLACKDHRRKTRLFVIARSLEDARDLPRFEIARISAITAFGENIGQLDVARNLRAP